MQRKVQSDLQSRFEHDETQNFEIVRVYRVVIRPIPCHLPHTHTLSSATFEEVFVNWMPCLFVRMGAAHNDAVAGRAT